MSHAYRSIFWALLSATWLSVASTEKTCVAQDAALAAQLPGGPVPTASEQTETSTMEAVQSQGKAFVDAFNAGKVDALLALFAEDGEVIDENGVLYRGKEELKQLFSQFFAAFPNATIDVSADSIRPLGKGMAIEEGSRQVTVPGEQAARAVFRYVAIHRLDEKGWVVQSIREVASDPMPTNADWLKPLDWMTGKWINEGSDANVQIEYKWNDERTFLLGEFEISRADEPLRKTSQRIGWDPLNRCYRSWVFEADGAFSQSLWTPTENGYLIKSSAVSVDGMAGSATIRLSKESNDRFKMIGTDRVIGGELDEDFEIVIVRRPEIK